jgi:hypothetical protein
MNPSPPFVSLALPITSVADGVADHSIRLYFLFLFHPSKKKKEISVRLSNVTYVM